MTDDVKALVERLNKAAISASEFSRKQAQAKSLRQEHDPPRDDLYMWASPEQTLEGKSAAALTAQAEEIERLNAIVKRVQAAAKTIMHHEGEELARLRKQAQEHHLAIRTLDSEREANALLTDEVERLRKALASIVDDCEADYPPSHGAIKYTAVAALKAAQEVKAIESGEHLKEGR